MSASANLKTIASLSRENVLDHLAKKLNCSKNDVSFLLGHTVNEVSEKGLEIPDIRAF